MYACIHYAGCAHTQIVWHMERSWGTKADPLATNRRATREGPMIMAVAGNRSSDTHYTYALFMMCAAAACIFNDSRAITFNSLESRTRRISICDVIALNCVLSNH